MSFQDKANQLFKDVEWTGGSNIHASLARSGSLEIHPSQIDTVMAAIIKANLPKVIWKTVQHHFGTMSWELNEVEFSKLCLVDMRNHLLGKPDTQSEGKLTNPVTGNQFHRMAFIGDVVGGIRFWCDPGYEGVDVGFRFRLENLSEEEETVRLRMRRIMEQVEEEYETMQEAMFDIKEPTKSEQESAEKVAYYMEVESD